MSAPYEDHIPVDQLAELAVGGLGGPGAPSGLEAVDAAASPLDPRSLAHLASCDQCRSTFDTLLAVPSVLATHSSPPIPPDVIVRVEAAVQREAMAVRAGTVEGSSVQATDVARARSGASASRPRRSWAAAAAALGTATVLGVGYAVVAGGTGSLVATEGGTGDGITEGYRTQTQGPGTESEAAPGEDDDTGSTGRTPVDGLGEITYAGLDEAVLRLVDTKQATSDSAPSETADTAGPCVRSVQAEAGISAHPLVAERALLDGQSVLVVVFEPNQNAGRLDVWVVSDGCLDHPVIGASIAPIDVVEHRTVRR